MLQHLGTGLLDWMARCALRDVPTWRRPIQRKEGRIVSLGWAWTRRLDLGDVSSRLASKAVGRLRRGVKGQKGFSRPSFFSGQSAAAEPIGPGFGDALGQQANAVRRGEAASQRPGRQMMGNWVE